MTTTDPSANDPSARRGPRSERGPRSSRQIRDGRLLGFALAVAFVASRFLLIPDGPWEQDEAIFATGVIDFSIVNHRPHPPGFPGWMLLGKIVNVAVGDALLSLRLLSGVASGLLGVVVWALLRRRLGDLLAALSAATLLATPSLWVHAPRAFTSTACMAALATAAASWGWSDRLQPNAEVPADGPHPPPQWRAILGWLMIAVALTIRPQLLPTTAILALGRLVQARHRPRAELLPLALAAALLGGVYTWAIVDCGGWSPFLMATRAHLLDHAGVTGVLGDFNDLGITRGLGGATATATLCILSVAGLWLECRADITRGLFLCALWATTLIMVLGAHHPGFSRYSVALVVVTWIPASLALRRIGRVPGVLLSLAALPWFSNISLSALHAMANQPLPPVATLRDIASAQPRGLAFSHGMFSFARLARFEGSLGDIRVTDMRSSDSPPRLPPGSWSLVGRSLSALPGNTVCELVHEDFPSAAARMSQDRFTRSQAYRDAVLLGDGHHQIERTDTGAPFVWWSDHAELAPPAGAELLTLRVASDSAHALIPWRASCDGVRIDEGTLSAGVQTLNLDIRACSTPIHMKLSETFRAGGDGRTLSARLLAAWATGAGLSIPSFKFSPGEPSTIQAAGVSFEGVYNAEEFGERRRGAWTGPHAVWSFSASAGSIWITLARPQHAPGPVRLRAGAEEVELDVTASPQRFRVPMRDANGVVRLELESPSFVPSELSKGSSDSRALGAIVFNIEVETSEPDLRCPSDP